jgi:2-amino-4-hydroxy-6-hydroxymethyldihydropteridine diphosphokinase
MTEVYIGLGSNLGDRLSYIQQAVQMLEFHDGIKVLETSSFYETEPYGLKDQGWFINAVVRISTELTAVEVLRICQHIEAKLGRKREIKWGPRVIDLDILFYGDQIIADDILTIPHPATYDRACCIVPLLEIAEDLIHPILQKPMDEIYQNLEFPEEVYLYGTKPKEIT